MKTQSYDEFMLKRGHSLKSLYYIDVKEEYLDPENRGKWLIRTLKGNAKVLGRLKFPIHIGCKPFRWTATEKEILEAFRNGKITLALFVRYVNQKHKIDIKVKYKRAEWWP